MQMRLIMLCCTRGHLKNNFCGHLECFLEPPENPHVLAIRTGNLVEISRRLLPCICLHKSCWCYLRSILLTFVRQRMENNIIIRIDPCMIINNKNRNACFSFFCFFPYVFIVRVPAVLFQYVENFRAIFQV